MTNQTIYFSSINLGCKKNLVDTQHLLGNMLTKENNQYELEYHPDPYDSDTDLVFINTCGFISTARAEMLNTIENLSEDPDKKIYVFGCGLYYFEKLINKKENKYLQDYQNIMQNDNIYKLNRTQIKDLNINQLIEGKSNDIKKDFSFFDTQRAYTHVQLGYDYIKIAEGCDNDCKFCIIPDIKGSYQSRSMERVLDKLNHL